MLLHEILVDTSDGFVDLTFPVLQVSAWNDGTVVVKVGGLLLGERVELDAYVQGGMLANDLSVESPVIHARADGISMSFEGDEGRNFATALSKLYGIPRSSFHMPVNLSCTAVNLEGNPANIANEPVKFKLFHETGSTEDDEGPEYFEMFFNLDLVSGTLALNEKDTEHRMGVMNSFPPEPV